MNEYLMMSKNLSRLRVAISTRPPQKARKHIPDLEQVASTAFEIYEKSQLNAFLLPVQLEIFSQLSFSFELELDSQRTAIHKYLEIMENIVKLTPNYYMENRELMIHYLVLLTREICHQFIDKFRIRDIKEFRGCVLEIKEKLLRVYYAILEKERAVDEDRLQDMIYQSMSKLIKEKILLCEEISHYIGERIVNEVRNKETEIYDELELQIPYLLEEGEKRRLPEEQTSASAIYVGDERERYNEYMGLLGNKKEDRYTEYLVKFYELVLLTQDSEKRRHLFASLEDYNNFTKSYSYSMIEWFVTNIGLLKDPDDTNLLFIVIREVQKGLNEKAKTSLLKKMKAVFLTKRDELHSEAVWECIEDSFNGVIVDLQDIDESNTSTSKSELNEETSSNKVLVEYNAANLGKSLRDYHKLFMKTTSKANTKELATNFNIFLGKIKVEDSTVIFRYFDEALGTKNSYEQSKGYIHMLLSFKKCGLFLNKLELDTLISKANRFSDKFDKKAYRKVHPKQLFNENNSYKITGGLSYQKLGFTEDPSQEEIDNFITMNRFQVEKSQKQFNEFAFRHYMNLKPKPDELQRIENTQRR